MLKTGIKLISILIVSSAISYGQESISNISEAINISGKQRMYTQRIFRDYVMLGSGNIYNNPQEDLIKSINAFDKHLNLLIKYNKDKTTAIELKNIKKEWEVLKDKLTKKPSKEELLAIEEGLEELLVDSNKAVEEFVHQTNKTEGDIVNIAGRQRMLSQRLAALYILKSWGIDDDLHKLRLEKTIKEYRKNLDFLKSQKINTDKIEVLLSKAEKGFLFFEIMSQSKSKTFIPDLIFKKSDDMLKSMDEATKLYAIETSKK